MDHLEKLKNVLDKPIVLVGLMGSGKSRIGSALAHTLGLEFYDTDRVVEKKAGYTINEIFKFDGERKFRSVEKNTVLEILNKGVSVIATGGGAVTNDGIPEALNKQAYTVWLKTDIQELARRLSVSKDRPLLRDRDIASVLEEMLAKRQMYYEQASITFDTTGLQVAASVEGVIKGLWHFLKKDIL